PDSPNTTYVATRPARYVRDRDPSQGPIGYPHGGGAVPTRTDSFGSGTRTRTGRAGLLPPQPCGFHLGPRRDGSGTPSPSQDRSGPRADGRGGTRAHHAPVHAA